MQRVLAGVGSGGMVGHLLLQRGRVGLASLGLGPRVGEACRQRRPFGRCRPLNSPGFLGRGLGLHQMVFVRDGLSRMGGAQLGKRSLGQLLRVARGHQFGKRGLLRGLGSLLRREVRCGLGLHRLQCGMPGGQLRFGTLLPLAQRLGIRPRGLGPPLLRRQGCVVLRCLEP